MPAEVGEERRSRLLRQRDNTVVGRLVVAVSPLVNLVAGVYEERAVEGRDIEPRASVPSPPSVTQRGPSTAQTARAGRSEPAVSSGSSRKRSQIWLVRRT